MTTNVVIPTGNLTCRQHVGCQGYDSRSRDTIVWYYLDYCLQVGTSVKQNIGKYSTAVMKTYKITSHDGHRFGSLVLHAKLSLQNICVLHGTVFPGKCTGLAVPKRPIFRAASYILIQVKSSEIL